MQRPGPLRGQRRDLLAGAGMPFGARVGIRELHRLRIDELGTTPRKPKAAFNAGVSASIEAQGVSGRRSTPRLGMNTTFLSAS